jgi:hypothetical protein
MIAFGMIGLLANPRVKARMERYHPGIAGLEQKIDFAEVA